MSPVSLKDTFLGIYLRVTRAHEKFLIMNILRFDFCPALEITALLHEVLASVLKQNFAPIIDARRCFCDIITRRAAIKYLIDNEQISDEDDHGAIVGRASAGL